MNDYLIYLCLLLSSAVLYLPITYRIGKGSIILKISWLILPSLIVLAFTSYTFAKTWNFLLFVPALLSLFLTVYILVKIIKKPIANFNVIISHFANGNLSIDNLDEWTNRKDEFGQISTNLKTMGQQLNDIISEIHTISKDVIEHSKQLNINANALSEGASTQAASIEEISSNIEEITSNVEQSSMHAQKAVSISKNAVTSMNLMSTDTKKTVSSMNDIFAFIENISSIANDTKILALNAAIEAARAGEHGKGFAVVSKEVKKLAENSEQISDKIVILTKETLGMADSAIIRIDDMSPQVENTSVMVNEITVGAIEQHRGLEQISSAMQQLNGVTQETSASSEEMSATADQLLENANKLNELMTFFNDN